MLYVIILLFMSSYQVSDPKQSAAKIAKAMIAGIERSIAKYDINKANSFFKGYSIAAKNYVAVGTYDQLKSKINKVAYAYFTEDDFVDTRSKFEYDFHEPLKPFAGIGDLKFATLTTNIQQAENKFVNGKGLVSIVHQGERLADGRIVYVAVASYYFGHYIPQYKVSTKEVCKKKFLQKTKCHNEDIKAVRALSISETNLVSTHLKNKALTKAKEIVRYASFLVVTATNGIQKDLMVNDE